MGNRIGRITLLVLVVMMLAGCATVPLDPEDRADFIAANDPMEPMNRAFFDFNMALDELLLEPIARGYSKVMPDVGQLALHNVLNNLRSPLIFANDILQANPERAAETGGRFVANSTIGLLGLIDVVALSNGPKFHDEDFGQTLAKWGIGEGPYLVLPFFGPSNVRDTIGFGVEFVADPVNLVWANNRMEWAVATRFGLGVLDDRTQLLDPLDDLKRISLDLYAAMRSVYRQHRIFDINNKDTPLADVYKSNAK